MTGLCFGGSYNNSGFLLPSFIVAVMHKFTADLIRRNKSLPLYEAIKHFGFFPRRRSSLQHYQKFPGTAIYYLIHCVKSYGLPMHFKILEDTRLVSVFSALQYIANVTIKDDSSFYHHDLLVKNTWYIFSKGYYISFSQ